MNTTSTDAFFAGSNLAWLRERTIFLTRHGSHAYGLNIATSDEDFKGVAIPPSPYFFGFSKVFEQAECKSPDLVIYDIRKFFRLARDCNPNIVEVLWCDESDHVMVTPAARVLLEHKQLFLSKKARHTFSGYALAQLKRINAHYRWLKDPPSAAPMREEFGLLPMQTLTADQRNQIDAAMAIIKRDVATWDDLDWTELDEASRIALKNKISEFLARAQISKDDLFMQAGRQHGIDDNYLDVLRREKLYRSKQQDWDNYQSWRNTRNQARAELEAKFGYDTKHAMHLVRLLRMCAEILRDGTVRVKRSDRDELLAIRSGAWSYEKLVEWAAEQDKTMDALYVSSTLPHTPDVARLDALCEQMVQSML